MTPTFLQLSISVLQKAPGIALETVSDDAFELVCVARNLLIPRLNLRLTT